MVRTGLARVPAAPSLPVGLTYTSGSVTGGGPPPPEHATSDSVKMTKASRDVVRIGGFPAGGEDPSLSRRVLGTTRIRAYAPRARSTAPVVDRQSAARVERPGRPGAAEVVHDDPPRQLHRARERGRDRVQDVHGGVLRLDEEVHHELLRPPVHELGPDADLLGRDEERRVVALHEPGGVAVEERRDVLARLGERDGAELRVRDEERRVLGE